MPKAMMTRPSGRLTHAAAQTILAVAIKAAEAMGVPQCIAIVDEGVTLLEIYRTDGTKVLSFPCSQAKAETAAASGQLTAGVATEPQIKLPIATGRRSTNLNGGLPIIIDGVLISGIGVGSGTGEQDRDVALAASTAVGLG